MEKIMDTFEVEAKWELNYAQYILLQDFMLSIESKRTNGYDMFFENPFLHEKQLLRFRPRPDGTGFITVKKLVAPYIRRENEIKLSNKNNKKEIVAFLDDIGYEYNKSIIKSGFSIEHLRLGDKQYHVALYLATHKEKVRYFLELEMDKTCVNHKNPYDSAEILKENCHKLFSDTLKGLLSEEEVVLCDKLLYDYF
jgi:hypothetical protein